MPKTGIDLLDEVLCVLDDLATQEDRERLAELRQRVEAHRLRVLIAGDAKRGKSTLLTLPTAEAGGFFLTKECSCFTEDRLPALGAGWSYTVSAG